MASLRGLFIILGITAFAGIGGLYALEELSERSQLRSKLVQLPKYQKEDDIVEPYTVNMETVKDDDGDDGDYGDSDNYLDAEQTLPDQTDGNIDDKKTNYDPTEIQKPEKRVIFEFHDSDDE